MSTSSGLWKVEALDSMAGFAVVGAAVDVLHHVQVLSSGMSSMWASSISFMKKTFLNLQLAHVLFCTLCQSCNENEYSDLDIGFEYFPPNPEYLVFSFRFIILVPKS